MHLAEMQLAHQWPQSDIHYRLHTITHDSRLHRVWGRAGLSRHRSLARWLRLGGQMHVRRYGLEIEREKAPPLRTFGGQQTLPCPMTEYPKRVNANHAAWLV